jgi:hypothetical protein
VLIFVLVMPSGADEIVHQTSHPVAASDVRDHS